MSTISNKAISDYLDSKNIMHSKIGYKYLMMAIRALLDGEADRYRIQSVYEYVGAQSGVQGAQIERSLRRILHLAGETMTNKEFLTRALDDLSLDGNENAAPFREDGT